MDADDYDYDIDYGYGPACPKCGYEMSWINCWNCGGEGSFDAYELDPLWYDPGDVETCQHCGGEAGWYVCTNKECHAEIAVIRPAGGGE